MLSHQTTATLRTSPAILACVACALAATATATAQTEARAGFSIRALSLPAPAKGWAGIDRLPDGNLVSFDGKDLVALDPATGRVAAKLTSLATAAFATDVRVGPSGETVFFGESSAGEIHEYRLRTKQTRRVTTLGGNFSFAFHPDDGERFLYVSARPGFTGTAKVFRIDTRSGALDLIAEAEGFAGPIAFDRAGALLFAPAPLQFGKPGLAKVLRWSRSQVVAAVGPGNAVEAEATVHASGFDNAIDLALDGEGTIYAADAFAMATSSVLEIAPQGGKQSARDVARLRGESLTTVAFAPGARPFERFGRQGASLWLLSSDFGSNHHLIEVSPKRPFLAVQPSATPPKNSDIRFDAAVPADSFAIWLLGAGLVPERPVLPLGAAGLGFPDFGIVLASPFLAVVTESDKDGRASLPLRTPNLTNFQWTTQVLAGPVPALPGGTPASPWVTTNPVLVTTQ